MSTRAKTIGVFKEMGKGMWRSGKGFGKGGAIYAGVECCIEAVSYFHGFLCDAGLSGGGREEVEGRCARLPDLMTDLCSTLPTVPS